MTEMSTLEARLREAFELGTADAGGPDMWTDLARGARTRSAARRRRRVAAMGLIGVLVVGLGVSTVIDDGESRRQEAPPASGERPLTREGVDVPSGWHVETWRGVGIQVPNTWGSGALSTWCERGPLLGVPVVERPGDPQSADPGSVRCDDPALGYGVQFLGPRRSEELESHAVRTPRPREAAIYPEEAWVGITCGDCDVAVRVIAPSPHVARYLLDTYTRTSPSG